MAVLVYAGGEHAGIDPISSIQRGCQRLEHDDTDTLRTDVSIGRSVESLASSVG